MKLAADGFHPETQNIYGADHAGGKSRLSPRLVQHDAAQGMDFFLILPQELDDAPAHDAAVGITVPARGIPLHQQMDGCSPVPCFLGCAVLRCRFCRLPL